MKKILILFLSIATLLSCRKSENKIDTPAPHPDTPAPGPVTLKDSVIVSTLDIPWEILWGPDNFIWVTERRGRISRINPVSGEISLLISPDDAQSNNEGGMLGMVLHPDFNSNPFLYVVYDYKDKGGTYKGKVVRYMYSGGSLSSPTVLLDNIGASTVHNGSRLMISPDLKLFITTGDASNQANSQDTAVINGKILRINLDGSIPDDNPFPGSPIWSYGHRNPQGLVMVNGKIFSSEHGPDTDDEINIIQKGRDYGWPDVMGYCDLSAEQAFCQAHQVVEPIKAWTPTIAPSGLDYYDKDQIPQWKNSLLLATLKDSRLIQLQLDDAQEKVISTQEFYVNKYGRMRDICISPAGDVYVCTSNGNGADKLIRISAAQ
jgi:aldose sugar dehydrogenase